MKKIILINGSPRKNGNTYTLLENAMQGAKSVGAECEIMNLYDLNFKGCTSCFACKIKDSKFIGKCAMSDDLSPVLALCMKADAIIFGSPIYLSDITSDMRAFMERLLFMNHSYNQQKRAAFEGEIATGFIYTMGAPKQGADLMNYNAIYELNKRLISSLLHGKHEFIVSDDNYQFSNYSKYETTGIDVEHKAQHKANQFPIDCKNAFNMGVALSKN